MHNELNKRWVPNNPLTRARDRHRDRNKLLLGDAKIIPTSPISPITKAITRPMVQNSVSPMIRKMGETTIETRRRRRGNPNLWANTPAQNSFSRKTLEDIDITDELAEWDSVGWEWNRRTNKLIAYLTTNGQTYTVKIPASRLKRIFNRCLAQDGCVNREDFIRETTIDGIFKKIGKGLKKATRGIGRAVKNPKKFLQSSGKAIKFLVKKVGKAAVNVASSPIFAGAMTALAAVPPLTAVGGAGLAAFAAANAIKPAMKAAETAVDTVDGLAKKKKASEILSNVGRGINGMPGPAKKMMKGALKSVSDKQLNPKQRKKRKSKARFRLRGNKLMPWMQGHR